MIIQRPILTRFSPAIREALPGLGDGQLQVDPAFNLAGIPPEPIFRGTAGANPITETSNSFNISGVVTNAGTLTTQQVRLKSGWWRINTQGLYVANYFTAIIGSADFSIFLDDGVNSINLVTLAAGLNLPQQWNMSMDLLIPSPAQGFLQITSQLIANGVGQSHGYNGGLYVYRLL
jgi:hypothetical protein